MLRTIVRRFWVGRARRTVRGSVTPIFAVMSLPVLLSVGVGVDMTRMTLARSALQSAVDGAALAGAAAGGYSKSAGDATTNATNAATNYFNGNYTHGGQGSSVTSAGAQIVPTVTLPATTSGYKVTVSATGTMSTTFLGVASINSVVIQAHATANNTTTPGSGPKLVVKANNVGSYAADWNAVYIYSVPLGADGVKYDFTYIPKASELYLAGTNCPSTSSNPIKYCNNTQQPSCSPPGANLDLTKFPNSKPDAPIAMVIINVTAGLWAATDVKFNPTQKNPDPMKYGDRKLLPPGDEGTGMSDMNSYGARYGSCQVFMTSLISDGQSPAKYADSGAALSLTSAYVLSVINNNGTANALPIHSQTTHYSDVSKSNCLLVVQNIDPNAIPSAPPTKAPGNCFSLTSTTDTVSGKEYANLSCNQMAGRTFMYWINDMGWYPIDDKDYQNLSFTFRCDPGSSSVTSATVTTPVSLMK